MKTKNDLSAKKKSTDSLIKRYRDRIKYLKFQNDFFLIELYKKIDERANDKNDIIAILKATVKVLKERIEIINNGSFLESEKFRTPVELIVGDVCKAVKEDDYIEKCCRLRLN